MKSALILGLATQALAATAPRGVDVWGGEDTDIKTVPYQIEFDLNGKFDCGGSVISSRYILTAGHCVKGRKPSDITIRAGSNQVGQGKLYKIAAIQAHPKFVLNSQGIDYDIALLQTAEPIAFSDSVKTVPLVDTSAVAGDNGLLSGWGRINAAGDHPDVLQSVTYPVISKEQCNKMNTDNGAGGTTDRFICALYPGGGKGSCFGDSGGPLVVNGKLAGTVSGGHKCAGADSPGTYADVGHPEIRSWIKKVAGV